MRNPNKPTKPKPNFLKFKNCYHFCAYRSAQLSYTTKHGAVLVVYPLNLLTTITALTLSTGCEWANEMICRADFNLDAQFVAVIHNDKVTQRCSLTKTLEV